MLVTSLALIGSPSPPHLCVQFLMAADSLQPAAALLQVQPVLRFGNGHQRRTSAGQQLLSERSYSVTGRSFPAIPGSVQECEPRDFSWSRGYICQVHLQKARQELLWRQFFFDSTLWWDERQHKKSSRSPDFIHRESREVLWLNNFHKPAWVDAQLAALDTQTSSTSIVCPVGYARDPGAETVSKLCVKGQLSEAVDALELLVLAESPVSDSLFYSVLKLCVAQKDLVLGRRVDDLVVKVGYESNTFLSNHILRMYASQGRLQQARDVFTRVADPDAFMWSSIISAYAKHGQAKQAVQLYHEMRCSSLEPDCHVFVAALQACACAADLESGRRVHADVLNSGVQPNLFVWNCVVDMYAKCSRLEDARKVFDSLPRKDVVTWTIMIAGYAEHQRGQEALSLYEDMEQECLVVADSVTFACLLKACTSVGAIQQGEQLHLQIVERGLESDIVVSNCLVDMYAKCGRFDDARRVFDNLATKDVVTWNAMINGYAKGARFGDACELFDNFARRDVVSWNSMIAGYAEHGLGQEALALYARMVQEGMIEANRVTFICLLMACTRVGAVQQGKQVHSEILRRGLEFDVMVGNSLVDMYSKCGRLNDARRVFESLPTKDVVTWTMMINGFGQSNEGHKAIECFQEMLQDGVLANEATFTALLVACSHEGLVKEGQEFFKVMVEEHKILPTVEHYTCMVDLLGRAGYLDEAEKMLLSFESDDVGFLSLLNACKSHTNIERGLRCFEWLMRSDPENASAYVLMGKIYADAGRWSDVERIERLRKSAGASKKPAVAGIEVDRHVHTFVVGEGRSDTSSKVRSMNNRLKEDGGHVPHTESVLKRVAEIKKEDDLCGHAEKLALAYGLLNTPDGTPLMVTKNLRMCRDCHSSTEIMSRVEKREIIVRDGHRVHRFVEGACLCGGRP